MPYRDMALDQAVEYPEHLSLGDILQRLAVVAPAEIDAIRAIANDRLRRHWIARHHALLRLVRRAVRPDGREHS